MSVKRLITILSLIFIGVSALYLLYEAPEIGSYVWLLRWRKYLAYFIVVIAVVPSTIVFQTIFQSRYLSPGLLGMDAVYVLAQTLFFFTTRVWFNMKDLKSIPGFFIQLSMMLMFFGLLVWIISKSGIHLLQTKDTLLVMLGLVFGQVLRSFSTFLQVLMDPTDYDSLFSRLLPSFQRVTTDLLVVGLVVVFIGVGYFLKHQHELDTYQLGHDTALSFGVEVPKVSMTMMVMVIIMIGTSTAIIGPLTFLGFMVANITYYLVNDYHHWQYFVVGILLGGIFVVDGQFILEHITGFQYNLSMFIDIAGGLFFFTLLLRGGDKNRTS